ncbi:hypothetical protein PsorP6_001775 [Peronosclerospora sorghi]|uniref:Uncharacterized protein n=1 Tax=Peronosclerospora sorghi TaxID=230839 RepID=A0ACC0WR56_9STRA|nr:hypothetical protein PsorP6_001775 [Peronosclerospora sorghi]
MSPADSNASETLNTLQYANHTKNIQNKAVKNISSRSAELTNLKAFNNLLCRELVKAILSGEGVLEDVDKLTTTLLANPHVVSSLSKMKQLTAAAGLEMSSDDRFDETQCLVNHFKAHVRELVPRNGCRQVVPMTCLHGNEGDDIKSEGEKVDCFNETEFSVAIIEEQTTNQMMRLLHIRWEHCTVHWKS